jgi:ubiquinone/menaquinone biosynthesis C-methylase UbiE
MDAEHLAFPDASFDFVWSWGVIHHSSNTWQIVGEIQRVLKPGGTAVIMVYHRGWWNYYVWGMLIGPVRAGA